MTARGRCSRSARTARRLTLGEDGLFRIENGQGHSIELSASGHFTGRVAEVDWLRT